MDREIVKIPPSRGQRDKSTVPKVDPKRFLSIVVVVILVSATLAGSLYWYASQFEGGKTDPLSTDAITIDGDTVWKGRDENMERPVIVTNGATLRIKDCHIRVLLEDLFLWNISSWFTVKKGCTLEVEGSTLEVVVHDLLEDAVYMDHRSIRNFDPDDDFAYISRIVNLVGTDDPVLSFDVAWRGAAPMLLVVGQETMNADLQLLESFGYEEMAYGEWTHHEVDLRKLEENVARIAIVPMDLSMDGMLISNVTITDGGRMPSHDVFPTGDPADDWWTFAGSREFLSLEDEMESWNLWPSLILADSQVTFEDSRVVAPPGMSRWIKALVDREKLQLPDNGTLSNTDLASRGCHIEVEGGYLSLVRTDVEHVPILAWRSVIEMSSSNVTGDADDITLHDCSGALEDVHLRAVAPEGWRPFSYGHKYDGQFLWSLSIEGDREGRNFELSRCVFESPEVALVAKDTSIHLTDCTFSNVETLCIWDHGTHWDSGWTGTYGQLRFEGVVGMRYLETVEKTLLYDGPNKPEDNEWGHYEGTLELMSTVDRPWPDIGLAIGNWDRGVMHMPVVVIDGGGETELVDEVKVFADTGWARGREVTIGSTDTVVEVWLTWDNDPTPHTPYTGPGLFYAMRSDISDSNITGQVVLEVYLLNRTLAREGFYRDLEVRVTVDGVPFDTYDAMEDISSEDNEPEHEFRIPVGSGATVINATLYGSNNTTTQPVIIDYREWSVYRHSVGCDLQVLRETLSDSSDITVIDPGLEVELTDIRPFHYTSGDYTLSRLDLILPEGSSLSLSAADIEQPDFLDVYIEGNGSLMLEGFSTRLLNLNCDGANIQVVDCIIDHSITTFSGMRCDLLIEGCIVTLPGWGPWIGLSDMDARIRNTTFRNEGPARYEWEMISNASLEVSNCTFVNVTLGSSPDLTIPHNVTLEVHDCTFRGKSAFLALTNPYFKDYGTWPDVFVDGTFDVDIGGNTFVGPKAGIVGFPEQLRDMGNDNELLEGAVVFAQFKSCATVERSSHYYNVGRFFMDGARASDKSFMGRHYDVEDDATVLMDVTGDPSIPKVPTEVWVMVREERQSGERVRGFNLVPISNVTMVLDAPAWDHMNNLLRPFLQDLWTQSDKNGDFWVQ